MGWVSVGLAATGWSGVSLPSSGGGGDPELVAALQAQVTTLEGTVSTQAGQITTLQTAVQNALPNAYVYRLANASSQGDPSGINNTAITAIGSDGEYHRFVLRNPGGGAAAATLPGAAGIGGTYAEHLARDMFGAAITVDRSDIASILAWLGNASGRMPNGTYMGLAFTAGGVGDLNNSGVFVGMRYNASGNEAIVSGNAGTGSGWVTMLAASAIDALMTGIKYGILRSNGSSSVFRNVIAIDAAGEESVISNASPLAPASNTYTDSPMTHVAVIAGWSDATGTAPATIDVSLRSAIVKWNQLRNYAPNLIQPVPTLVDPPTDWLVIGDSNSNGTQVDSVYAGVAVETGWTYRHNGTNAANWPSGNNPSVGPLPYIVALAKARGATGGRIIRRGTNGGETGFPGTIHGQISGAIDDVVALGNTSPHVIVLVLGANDSNDAAEAAAHLRNMRRIIRILRRRFPFAKIVLWNERMLDSGVYPAAATIASNLVQLASEFPGVGIADGNAGTPAANFDNVHFTDSPAGHGVMATRTFVAAGYT
jgi:hypothetical protein